MLPEIPITVRNPGGQNRIPEPIKVSVPFPKGLLTSPYCLEVTTDSLKVDPLQVTPLAQWADGSLQWVLLEFFASADEKDEILYLVRLLEFPSPVPSDSGHLPRITQHTNTSCISTGKATFEIQKDVFAPFRQVLIEDRGLISKQGSALELAGVDGNFYKPVITHLNWHEVGPVRASLVVKGWFITQDNHNFAAFRAMLDFFINTAFCKLRFQIHNPRAAIHPGGVWDLGDPGSIFFSDLSLSLPAAFLPSTVHVYTDIKKDSKHYPKSDFLLYQDSSGGKNWNSLNHVDCDGTLTTSFRGYKLWSLENNVKQILEEGHRATPYMAISNQDGWVCGSVKDFWQNFPKALSVVSNTLKISLFPSQSTGNFELQGGERKTHTILLEFGNGSPSTNLTKQLLDPLQVSVDPVWIAKTGALPYFIPEAQDQNKVYLDYVKNVVQGPNSFFNKREIIDEYGWRNFGDIFADHEAVHTKKKSNFISHYNNQFDFIFGAGVHFLRSGDQKWFQLMDDLAQHVMDIDIYHTDDDKPAYSHGLFWHTDHYRPAGRATHRTYSLYSVDKRDLKNFGGGPSNEHNYTSGLALYYLLTGDLLAKEAVLELAQWVMAMDDGAKTPWAFIDDGPTGLASQTVFTDYHGPGRGAANSINALVDAYKLSKERKYLDKAEELITRCIHPKDDIPSLKLDDPEYKWSYLVFLQVIGKYLDFKYELGELDWNFFYARDALLHYCNWMLKNEVPYKEVLHKVDIPTETWPAQDIRKSCVLNYAFKYGPPESKLAFKDKARFFFDRCLEDLLGFDTACLTRPMVILSVYGYMQAYFDHSGGNPISTYLAHNYDFGSPSGFKPQRLRLKASAIKKTASIAHIVKIGLKGAYHRMRIKLLRKGRKL